VSVVIGWEPASNLWRSHLPDPLIRDAGAAPDRETTTAPAAARRIPYRRREVREQIAEQFMADMPHGGDLEALQVTFVSATQKTREAVAQYRAWLVKQQGGLT
jgi:hypothetical protein